MKQSWLFTKNRKEEPKDELATNAKWLIRGSYIHKESAGVYSFLPLGWRVLEKINQLIRREMASLGAQEIQLSAMQNIDLWRQSQRLDLPVAFKLKLNAGGESILAWTHEEPVTNLMRDHIRSYRDLPIAVYQIQTKFRNEERAKSGILRGREFLMKDMYSFHTNENELDQFYEQVKGAYLRIFEQVGLGDKTFVTFASGGAFSKYSHEFQTLAPSGEDLIYLDRERRVAVNEEVYNETVLSDLKLDATRLEKVTAIEVANIFKLGTKFSEPLNLRYVDESGNSQAVVMGCYGLGPSRLLGTIAELTADQRGLCWPSAIAPFKIHLLAISNKEQEVNIKAIADDFYRQFQTANIDVLYDDRELPAGVKLAEADLLGLPYRLVISSKTLTISSDQGELTERSSGQTSLLSPRAIIDQHPELKI